MSLSTIFAIVLPTFPRNVLLVSTATTSSSHTGAAAAGPAPLAGSGIDTSALGLDAAAPAIFLALLWPQLSRERAGAVALGAAVVALGLIPLAPAGVPIIAAAAVAILAGLLPARRRHETES
jgi:predicted branched-subunit amino acid permease